MKTELTPEESAKLIELGVDPTLASSCYNTKTSENCIFTLTDILAILPKGIVSEGRIYHVVIHITNYFNEALYEHDEILLKGFARDELIDALYQLLIWCIANGHYNPKNEEK